MERWTSALGILVMIGLAWALSTRRRAVSWRLVGAGVALQVVFGFLVLRFPPGQAFFSWVRGAVTTVLDFTFRGSLFVFGDLAQADGSAGFVFAFRVLPTLVFFSSLMGVLYHLGVMQKLVTAMARGMTRTMGVSGSESLSMAANVFIGQTEAPLVIRPYIARMTTSEIMVLMTGGMATIAGGVLAGYVAFGIDAGHLLAASVMSAPAAIVMAKILVPETEQSLTAGTVEIAYERKTVNVVDAAADGASQGMHLALNVGAMLIAFLALIALADYGLGVLHGAAASIGWNGMPSTLNELFGILFWPLAWVMGVTPADASTFAGFLGEKITVTEFIAYSHLAEAATAGEITERTATIGTYALCGFANFGSIGIQIGGIGGLAPERRGDLARLGLRALVGGALASWMTACVAGVLA